MSNQIDVDSEHYDTTTRKVPRHTQIIQYVFAGALLTLFMIIWITTYSAYDQFQSLYWPLFGASVLCLPLVIHYWTIKPIPSYEGIAEPRSSWLTGHLGLLGPSPALTYRKWAQQLRKDVIQVRLGTKRIVVINSYDAGCAILNRNVRETQDRPATATFNTLISTTQGLTVGTSPYGKSYCRKRRMLGSFVGKSAIKQFYPFINEACERCIAEARENVGYGAILRPHNLFELFSITVSLRITYGTDGIDPQLARHIIDVEHEITKYRGICSSNFVDYIPALQALPLSVTRARAAVCRDQRDVYLQKLKRATSAANVQHCIISNARSEKSCLHTQRELDSICLTMVSAGLDTIGPVIALFMGHMSTEYGQVIQEHAVEALYLQFEYEDPYYAAVESANEVPYIRALLLETLRFSGMPIGLARKTGPNPIIYNDHGDLIRIPPHATLLLNIYASNFDPRRYENPDQFDPMRFMNEKNDSLPEILSFGVGSRMCAGKYMAEREIYVAIIRVLLSFRISPGTIPMPTRPEEIYASQSALMFDIPDFNVKLEPRERRSSCQ